MKAALERRRARVQKRERLRKRKQVLEAEKEKILKQKALKDAFEARAASRIQALKRGQQGRAVASQRRKERNAALKIQYV